MADAVIYLCIFNVAGALIGSTAARNSTDGAVGGGSVSRIDFFQVLAGAGSRGVGQLVGTRRRCMREHAMRPRGIETWWAMDVL